ncbi:sodium/hydrogen exchanger 9B1 [Orussus abietinus]|uniref:sodium/hydrogen exchanger 9B1 n=1 Tax=Orussus abietinus TaxID=222816 RepID=UPI000625ECDD|nr:sodium/hydrogen exchanger 9B1 [Orussus abietinus]
MITNPNDGATTSGADPEEVHNPSILSEKLEEDEDDTCCRKVSCCVPILRELIVTQPVFPCCHLVTWSTVFWLTTSTILIFMSWATLYFIIGESMFPGGSVFGLFALFIFGYVLGWSLSYIPFLNVPPVFGMLVAGIIVRNTIWRNFNEDVSFRLTGKIRTFCITFIMMRAGLQITTSTIRDHSFSILTLALIPCTIELILTSILSKLILSFPWNWAFLSGTILACMSPVLTVNTVLGLAEVGYGEDKDMATFLCTASTIDNVHITSLFPIFFSFVMNGDKRRTEWWSYIPGGLRDLLLSIIVGTLLGTLFVFFPHRKSKHSMLYRIFCLVAASLMCTSAASKMGMTGAGFLTTVILSFIATTGWRYLTVPFDALPVRKVGYFLWHFLHPVLVSLVGAEIDLHNWHLKRFGLYTLIVFVGAITRSILAALSAFKTPQRAFTLKERLFIALAWLPKGSLQAALAPMAYEIEQEDADENLKELVTDLVRLSTTSIIFLAPLGAFLMPNFGPLLLNKASEEEVLRRRKLSYLRLLSLQPVTKFRRKSTRQSQDQHTESREEI